MSSNWRRWTDQEAEDFLLLLSAGRPFNDVCASFGRNPGDARKHLRAIGAMRSVESPLGRPRSVAMNPAVSELVDVMPHQGEPKPAGDVDTGCRWLFPQMTRRSFCGQPKEHGYSWCSFHKDIVFTRSNGSP